MGMDFVRFRPWIVVVEVRSYNSEVLRLDWEKILLENGYRYNLYDGVNHYYA